MFEQVAVSLMDSQKDASLILQEIDSRVEYWHTHETGCTLREYLGMEPDEYELWLKEGDEAVTEILKRRRKSADKAKLLVCPYCGMKVFGFVGKGKRCPYCRKEMRIASGF